GPNDGTRRALSTTVTNRFAETWDHARIVFELADHDSAFAATGGTVTETLRRSNGKVSVAVDCVLPAAGNLTVSVAPVGPAGVGGAPALPLRLFAPEPDPWRPAAGVATVRFVLPAPALVDLAVFDVTGTRVATLVSAARPAGDHAVRWSGTRGDGRAL